MADAKQGKAPEDFYNGSSSQSRVVLAKPRLGGFGSSSLASSSNKASNPFGSVLRPSQLKPTINPFVKATDPSELDETKNVDKSVDKLKKTETEVPKFVPLGSNTNARTGSQVPAPAQPTSSTSSASFVFGQNLSARVIIENVNNGEAKNGEAKEDNSSTNGTELLFTSAAASVKENNQEEASTGEGATTSSGSGLAAAAAEYERSHARPPPPAASYNLTGEEDETNVMQISCRLFAWETGSWRERGRGVLRLNDAAGGGGARLVARVAGSLRVVLNTKLWPDMVADRAGTKSLRITAADAHNQVKLFLIMGAPLDITQLHRALSTRIAASSKRTVLTDSCTVTATSQQAAERLEAAADDDADYLDKTDSDTNKDTTDKSDSTDQNERLDSSPKHKTEEYESNVDGMNADDDTRSLKRKEQLEDETSPKRQCPEITKE